MANPGLIWLDESSAQRAISEKERAGAITATEAANLKKFSEDGYFIVPVELTAGDVATIDGDVDRLWRERPSDVAFAYDSPPRRFSEAVAASDRRPRYRIHELHSASDVALRLYLHPLLHRYASLLLGETAVATQSLYFEFGSQQALHRDSTVVPTPEFGRLVAAWIALEDIAPESGPLMYVPQSQRFPFYEFSMWHSALMHGGAPPANEARTRKSFVVHYSTLRTHPSRECAVREMIQGVDGESVFSTDSILDRDGARGFANPLHGTMIYRR